MSCPDLHRQVVLANGVPVRVDWYDLLAMPTPRKLDPANTADAALIASAKCCEDPTCVDCGEACETAVQLLNGRPSNTGNYELIGPGNVVEISATGWAAFLAAYTAKFGGSTWSAPVEQSWACPCPPGLVGQPAGTYYIEFNGDTASKLACVAIAEAPNAPEQVPKKARRTVGCNDDRRDNLLQSIADALICDIAIPEKIAELAAEQEKRKQAEAE